MTPLEEDIKRCVDFHGHLCPGLALGIVGTRAGLETLGVSRADDEEVVSVMETDACCADAVQVLSGSTFGKGNFIYRDVGKVAFTLMSREGGKSVRLCLKPDVVFLSDTHRALMSKVTAGSASEPEIAEFWEHHNRKAVEILGTPWQALFSMKELAPQIPPKAKVEPSQPCDRCGEPVMGSKLLKAGSSQLCQSCHTT